ncbi:MAG: hypothetical protein R3C24_17060 [Cyanobacteriota/Melainabacteria group bacterium]|nr:hypothetical protein [Cyanobacteria bacterium HKST-UBA01]
MNRKLKTLLGLTLAQTIIALSLPLGAIAGTSDGADSPDFALPLNDKIQLSTEGGALVTEKIALPENVGTNSSPILSIEEALGEDAEVAVLTEEDQEVIVIDNDLETEVAVEEEYKWEQIADSPDKTKIAAGARFPVCVISSISSKTAKKGDPVEARLMTDIKIGGRLIARQGDQVIGRIDTVSKARRILHAELSRKRWMRANGSLGVQFDEIVTADGKHLPLVAKPARVRRVVSNKNEGRVLGVNHNGELASPLSTQLKHQAVHLAIRGAASVGGVFSMGAVPAAYGIIGAINPSFAFLQPVGKNVPHRRMKGFAMGVVSGLPGGFLIADTIIKGKEAVIKPGDTFLAEFKDEFTGRAATSAELLPGASGKVRGEVMPENHK